jgi:hypothetical protein
MSTQDFWSMLMALMAIVAPLALAWVLVSQIARRRAHNGRRDD